MPVTSCSAPKFRYMAENGTTPAGLSRSKAEAAPKLSPGAGLLFALILSLGLWAVIWRAVSSVAAAWLG
jgi:hypothetical protein